MRVMRKMVSFWWGVVFAIYHIGCYSQRITGETCLLKNGFLDCKSDRYSDFEKQKILNSYKQENCGKNANNELSQCCRTTFKPAPDVNDDRTTPSKPTALGDGDKPSFGVVDEMQNLGFHWKSGRNVIVSRDGKAAYRRVTPPGYGAVISNRPLLDGDIFDVWVNSLEDLEKPWLGVTTHSPEDIVFPEYMFRLRPGTWAWDVMKEQITQDQVVISNSYPERDLEIERGDRFGVSLDGGTLHFHHNGRNLGRAAHGLNGKFYAFIDLFLGGTNITIVE